ncbi:aminomethyl-transferring glycine dehydrogenase subunit GcvPA [Desulfuromonas sp. AOP6]|uniref:aminomethyl-transferring glycine dehydrogenase subunit GcvPA n=1 Tax=Desulfuromonas sp. AOP6 TaxID=1566351 RepID=UPI001279F0EB|nr:aminomethyl-transferring glycine dehydrogenase subunit GcvPA [Desulfuromonas sp. AOP6]BCA78965.1 glycine dehydrogenase [Desulfuromonas sp. AOP6]
MSHPYIPHTDEDVRQMLSTVGVPTVDALFEEIPGEVRLRRSLELPAPLAESDLLRDMKRLAGKNATVESHVSFLGGGAYNHFLPAVVDYLVSRSEFTTAYTPYQPEISQGTLQAIFEFQTMICQLTGMDVANASMYDGASACAEAVLMAMRATRRRRVLMCQSLHPHYRETVRTYCQCLDVDLVEVPWDETGKTSSQALHDLLDGETAALVTGYPNFFGVIEDVAGLAGAAHAVGARLVVAVQEPVALGLLKSPGELGADLVVGEGQSFGIPLSFGGPSLGFFACRQQDLRSMPGRLVGETVDAQGRRGYVLTLSTREQHIRREKATSNICSNQGLCALTATIWLALLGKKGIRELACHNLSKAAYARRQLAALPGFSLPFTGPVFNEFVVKVPGKTQSLLDRLAGQDILGGIALAPWYEGMDDCLLVCVTEQNSRAQIDALVAALAGGA